MPLTTTSRFTSGCSRGGSSRCARSGADSRAAPRASERRGPQKTAWCGTGAPHRRAPCPRADGGLRHRVTRAVISRLAVMSRAGTGPDEGAEARLVHGMRKGNLREVEMGEHEIGVGAPLSGELVPATSGSPGNAPRRPGSPRHQGPGLDTAGGAVEPHHGNRSSRSIRAASRWALSRLSVSGLAASRHQRDDARARGSSARNTARSGTLPSLTSWVPPLQRQLDAEGLVDGEGDVEEGERIDAEIVDGVALGVILSRGISAVSAMMSATRSKWRSRSTWEAGRFLDSCPAAPTPRAARPHGARFGPQLRFAAGFRWRCMKRSRPHTRSGGARATSGMGPEGRPLPSVFRLPARGRVRQRAARGQGAGARPIHKGRIQQSPAHRWRQGLAWGRAPSVAVQPADRLRSSAGRRASVP